MTGNRSLDDFLAGEPDDGSGEHAEDGRRSSAGSDPVKMESELDAVPSERTADEAAAEADRPTEPLAETFVWTGTGAACADCGEPATTRWRDGDVLVCDDCKPW